MAGRKRQMRKLLPMSQQNEDLENLLVFGYECKLFRDDEKALHIDRGGHLIPWMGDPSLQIDRYDGRGYLYDLHDYDASRTAGQEPEMSEEEQRIEDLCDEERYLELHTDLAEKAIYEEEELKRLNAAFSDCYYDYGGYAAVGFNYSAEAEQDGADSNEGGRLENDEDEEAYEVPPELQLPEGIIPPVTVKMAKIMEKTAKFVSTQGTQMEIRIKMKQHDNPLFGFLDFHDELNPFYKHLVAMIKAGKYKPKLDRPPETKRQDSHPEGEYLHPSLMTAQRQPEPEINSKDFLESVKAKLPSGQMSNTLYAKLVSKMTASSGRSSPVASNRTVAVKSEADPSSHSGYKDDMPRPPPPPPILGATHPYVAESGESTSAYSPAVTNLPPPPGMEPVTLPSSSPPTTQPPPPGTVPPETVSSHIQPRSKRVQVLEDPKQEIIQDGDEIIIPPPPDVLPIIDKMAAYVAKNGPDFEMIVKTKTDERFQFLHQGHVHNLYYEYKKHMFQKEFATENVKVTITQTSQDAVGHTVVTKTTTTLANVQPSKGVSFSIKAKESEGPSLSGRKMALLYDSSDDEDGEHRGRREGETESTDGRLAGIGSNETPGVEKPARPEKTQTSLEELERRQAEDRQKDRISNAAREKVAQASREKQLQAERKRRAALFINMLKVSGPATAPGVSTSTSQSGSSMTGGPSSIGVKEDLKDAASTGPPSSSASMSPKMSPHTSRAQSPSSVTLIRSRGNSSTRSPPRPRSPVRSTREHRDKDRDYGIDRERSRDREQREREREREHERSRDKWERQRERDFRRSSIRSRSPVWSRRRSRSPRRRKRSKTPPSAYSIVRRSRSRTPKKRSRTRSKSPLKHKKKLSRKSRSRSQSREIHRKSPAKTRKRSRSRSKTRKSRSRSKSRKSRSRSKSKEKKCKKYSKSLPRKSKSRSRSRSRKPKSRSGSRSRKTKSRSKSPSKPKKSKRKSRTPSPVKGSKHSTELRDGEKLMQILEVKSDSDGETAEPDVIIQENSTEREPIKIVNQSPQRNHSGNGTLEEPSEGAPVSGLHSDSGSTYSATTPPSGGLTPPASLTSSGKAPVSQALLSKVRAMLKASRAQILKEEGI